MKSKPGRRIIMKPFLKKIVFFLTVISCVSACTSTQNINGLSEVSQPLAFLGAEGFGAYAKGGRNGKVIYVTNLNDSGPGSLRYAVDQEGGPVMGWIQGTVTITR